MSRVRGTGQPSRGKVFWVPLPAFVFTTPSSTFQTGTATLNLIFRAPWRPSIVVVEQSARDRGVARQLDLQPIEAAKNS